MIVCYFMNSTVLAKLKQDVGDRLFGPLSKIIVDEALPYDEYVIEYKSGAKKTAKVPDSPDDSLLSAMWTDEWESGLVSKNDARKALGL